MKIKDEILLIHEYLLIIEKVYYKNVFFVDKNFFIDTTKKIKKFVIFVLNN